MRLHACLVAAFIALSPLFAPVSVRAAGAHDLVRCPDTSAVYYLADDGRRYVFPNENVYHSWYPDFSDVRIISCEDLASFPIGERIEYQAGMGLVKIPSDPTVYAIEPDGTLRPIPDESTAEDLYGEDWAGVVDDLSEVFFTDYEVGEELAEGELPEGMVLEDEDGHLFRVNEDGEAEEIDVVLDTDQETVFEDHAHSLEELQGRLAVVLEQIEVLATEIERLQALLAELMLVDVEVEDEVEVDEVDEIEDEDDDREDAEDAIADAEEEIAEAEDDLAEDAAEGKDVSGAETLLDGARAHLALAEEALAAGDFATAESEADAARHDAMEARGKAVESIDEDEDDDDADEDEDEDEDEDDDDEGDDGEDEDEDDDDGDDDDDDADDEDDVDDEDDDDDDDDDEDTDEDADDEDDDNGDEDDDGDEDGDDDDGGDDDGGDNGGDGDGGDDND